MEEEREEAEKEEKRKREEGTEGREKEKGGREGRKVILNMWIFLNVISTIFNNLREQYEIP